MRKTDTFSAIDKQLKINRKYSDFKVSKEYRFRVPKSIEIDPFSDSLFCK